MPKMNPEENEAPIKIGQHSFFKSKNFKDDPSIAYDPKSYENESIKKSLNLPKDAILKSMPMPEYDSVGGKKIRQHGGLGSVTMPVFEKSGGVISLKKCKVSTVKKNSKSSKW